MSEPPLAAPSDAAGSELDGIDLGEAGSLVRMVEQGVKNPVRLKLPAERPERSERGAVPAPVTTTSHAAAAVESVRENTSSGSELAEARADTTPRFVSGTPPGYAGADRGGNGGGGLSDVGTSEQRHLVKEAIAYLRSIFDHPATWLVIIVVAGISVVTSVGRGRGK